jgi:hypothetical protein
MIQVRQLDRRFQMLDARSYLTPEAQKELRKYRPEFLATKLGVSKRRAEFIARGRVRVLAIEKELIEELLGEAVA